jgi:hypothetical protein
MLHSLRRKLHPIKLWVAENPWDPWMFFFDFFLSGTRSVYRQLRFILFASLMLWLADQLNASFHIPIWISFPILIVAGFFLLWFFLKSYLIGRYGLPPCRSGHCKSYLDYHWRVGALMGHQGIRTFRYCCRCGDCYVRRGKRFYFVGLNGEEHSYKRMVDVRRWVDDVSAD